MLSRPARAAGDGARRLLLPALLAAFLVTGIAVADGAGSAPVVQPPALLTRGFEDDVWFNAGWQRWIGKLVGTGAKLVELEIDWAHVEPEPPPSGPGSANPGSSQYAFTYIDNVLKRFRGTDIQPLLLITDAPRWAQAPGATAKEYASGGYEPNDAALRQFAQALSRRYSGHYRDPSDRHRFLPRVTYFQAWAEANMGYHLTPQWRRIRGRLINTGPTIYRNLLNAVYTGIKAGDPSAKVLFTGLESYGDPPGGFRTPPVSFLRSVLCLSPSLAREPCPGPAHFDVLASDPYDVGAPTTPAVSPTDASAPDLGRLSRVLRAAIARRTVVPATQKPLWVTEFGYDSNPPNTSPGIPSQAEQARWLEESLYVFAHEGVSAVIWYLLHDQVGSFATQYFSGVYLHDGEAKISLTAYRFPLVVRPNGVHAEVWGIAPAAGVVTIQRRAGNVWRTALTFKCSSGATFAGYIPLAAHGLYRALEGNRASLDWTY